jgi:hypothetical protein
MLVSHFSNFPSIFPRLKISGNFISLNWRDISGSNFYLLEYESTCKKAVVTCLKAVTQHLNGYSSALLWAALYGGAFGQVSSTFRLNTPIKLELCTSSGKLFPRQCSWRFLISFFGFWSFQFPCRANRGRGFQPVPADVFVILTSIW